MNQTKNNMPPDNIEPADLWAQICKKERAYKVIDSPLTLADGSKVPIAMQVLTQQECAVATIEAENFTKKALKNKDNSLSKDEMNNGYDTIYENRAMIEILFEACRTAVPEVNLGKKFFSTKESMARNLTTDQLAVLFREYVIVQQELGPIVSQMEQYELEAWIEKLVNGGSCYPLASLTSVAVNQLTMYMANLSWNYLMANTSVSLPLEKSLSEEELPEILETTEIVLEPEMEITVEQ
jgi:hypothetical protein